MDGFINLDKQIGPSSHDAVARIKRLLHCKTGHCGTLDPGATGVLPVCIGRATRLAEYITGQSKTYRAGIILGEETDSYDAQGRLLEEKDASGITIEQIMPLLAAMQGEIMQVPPAVSALKKDGEPLYKKARRGEEVIPDARLVRIYDIKLIDFSPGVKAQLTIEVSCGQGAYIRSIAHDLGKALGVGGRLESLRRTQVGYFKIGQAYTIEQIEEMEAKDDLSFITPSDAPLNHLPDYVVKGEELKTVLHGNPLVITDAVPTELCRIYDEKRRLLAIGRITQEENSLLLAPHKVLLPPEAKESYGAVAIGNFDGVHLGHRALLERLALMKDRGMRTAVISFFPHPQQLINGINVPLLNAFEEKSRLICDCYNADALIPLKFDRQLMHMRAEDFVAEIIVPLKAKTVIVGYNFTCGDRGKTGASKLAKICDKQGIGVIVVDEVQSPYGTVSSTAIRRLIEQGELEAANSMLGYWFNLEGEVIYGNQLGREFGYPTANFLPQDGLALPPRGVYAARAVVVNDESHAYDAVVNFGLKPTIGSEHKPLVEAHLFGLNEDLYGSRVRVYLGKFLRPERKFAGIEALKQQIFADSLASKDYLHGKSAEEHLPKCLR